jgi:hypothetical protein
LLEEVSFLSSRNTQLEEDTIALPGLQEDLTVKEKQIEVLLVLLGEKEEELQGALEDMKEIKLMYRNQIEELLGKIVPTDKINSGNHEIKE